MKTKLDQTIFEGIHESFKWAAIDKCGLVYVYNKKPAIQSRTGRWMGGCCLVICDVEFSGENWKTSLIRREKQEMKFKKKYIKLGKPYIEDRVIKVIIEEQSHVGHDFGANFTSSHGLSLSSMARPENALGDHRRKVYVRGDHQGRNHDPLIFDSLESYLKFEDAVKEYNEYFSKPQVKEVTMEELHKLLGYEVKIKE